jgi:hypothetical protein
MVETGIAYWASVTSANTTFEPVYCVELVVSDERANYWSEKGHKVKDFHIKNASGEPEYIGKALSIKRKAYDNKGNARPAPRLFDASKEPLNELVGNGSKVNVQFNPWEVENKFGKFKGMDFQAMQVMELERPNSKTEDGSELNPYGDGEEF